MRYMKRNTPAGLLLMVPYEMGPIRRPEHCPRIEDVLFSKKKLSDSKRACGTDREFKIGVDRERPAEWHKLRSRIGA